METKTGWKSKIDTFELTIAKGMHIHNDEERKEHRKRVDDEGGKIDNIAYTSPTKASLILSGAGGFNQLVGSCMRSSWFSMMKAIETNPAGIKGIRRMDVGKKVEQLEHEYADSSTYSTAHNVRLKVALTPGVVMVGEIDSAIDGKFILEIKSFYGYVAKIEIFGKSYVRKASIVGAPKPAHLMQVMQYLGMADEQRLELEYAIIRYIDRSDCEGKSFHVELEEQESGDRIPIVNGQKFGDYSLRAILSRQIDLGEHFLNSTLPPRDSEFEYSEAKINAKIDAGEMSKKAITEWQNKENIPGDWNCSYCNYQRLCLGRFPKKQESWPTNTEIIDTMHNKSLLPSSEQDEIWDRIAGSTPNKKESSNE